MERFLNRRIVLAQRPKGPIQRQHFEIVTAEIGEVPDGHVVLRVILAQIAPAARAVMTNTTGFDQTKVGDGILCAVVGEVVATSPGGPALGSILTSYALWEEYAVVPAAQTLPVLPGHPLVHNLGALGLNGLTAYFGMTRVGHPRTGETVVISAASGEVGHLAGQIAHHAGARVVGITGSDCKNQRLRDGYKFTQTVNHRSPDFVDDLRAACGESGADVYFDNVGGRVLNAMLPRPSRHSAIPDQRESTASRLCRRRFCGRLGGRRSASSANGSRTEPSWLPFRCGKASRAPQRPSWQSCQERASARPLSASHRIPTDL